MTNTETPDESGQPEEQILAGYGLPPNATSEAVDIARSTARRARLGLKRSIHEAIVEDLLEVAKKRRFGLGPEATEDEIEQAHIDDTLEDLDLAADATDQDLDNARKVVRERQAA